MKTKWQTVKPSATREKEIEALDLEQRGAYNFSRPMLEYLHNKGVRTLDDIANLTNVSIDLEHNPFEMQDVEKATDIISDHIDKNSYIMVFGDYDTGATRL